MDSYIISFSALFFIIFVMLMIMETDDKKVNMKLILSNISNAFILAFFIMVIINFCGRIIFWMFKG